MFKCNYCGSRNTRKLSAIYDEQTSISYESGTIKGTNFRGRFNNQIIHQTNLVRQIAPPTFPQGRKLEIIVIAVTSFVVGMIIAMFLRMILIMDLAFWGAIAFCIYGIYKDFREVAAAKKIYQKRIKEWDKSYRCSHCGNVFIGQRK